MIIVANYVNFITGQYIPVEGAIVEFNGEKKVTDDQGVVVFVAPEVNIDTRYPITASKADYKTAFSKIIVTNNDTLNGKIQGHVYENNGEFNGLAPLKGVEVIVYQLKDEKSQDVGIVYPVYSKTYTDDKGRYELIVERGYYRIEVHKDGYKPVKPVDVYVDANETVKVDFQLHRVSNVPPVVDIRYPHNGEKVSGKDLHIEVPYEEHKIMRGVMSEVANMYNPLSEAS